MHIKVLLLAILLFLFTGCIGEPEPDEFTKMRMDMQERQNLVFAHSVEKLESKKRLSHKKAYGNTDEIDPEEALRIQEEAERKRWLAVEIGDDEAEDWKALGLSPKNALRWKRTGLSYNTISVLIKEDVLPSEAIEFMRKPFEKYPRAFIQFSKPLFEFQNSCKHVIKAKNKELSLINRKCKEYDQLLNFSTISGYLADEYQDNDLSLEYVSKLRQVDSQKAYIQVEMEKRARTSMVNDDRETFVLLFPILETSPTEEEMFYIKKHALALEDSKRYKSYKYYEFWINKDKVEEEARLAAIEQQQVLKEAKAARLKQQANRMKALAYNKMVASECGELVTPEPSTGERVHIEGKVLYIIGKKGSNIFAYVVENNKDAKNYLVRNPNAKTASSVNEEISWSAITVGRVASVSLDDDGTASYNHYTSEDKAFYPMLKFVSPCAYKTKDLTSK